MIIDYLVGGGNLLILLDPILECSLRSNVIELTNVLGIYPRCSPLKGSKGNLIKIIRSDEFKSDIMSSENELFYPRGSSLIVKKRPFTKSLLRAYLNEKEAKPPIVVFTKYGNGKAIVAGSSGLLLDSALRIKSNLKLALSILSIILGIEISQDKIQEFLGIIKREEGKKLPTEEAMEVLSKEVEIPKPKIEERKEMKPVVKEETKEEAPVREVLEGQLMNKITKLEDTIRELTNKIVNLENVVDLIKDRVEEIYSMLKHRDEESH